MPDSSIVGISGTWALRFAVVTASARILPPRSCGTTVEGESNMKVSCPPITSTSAGPEPL